MAGEMFGTPVGFQAYQDDQIKLSELALKQQQVNSATAVNQAQIAHYASQDRAQQGLLQLKQNEANEERLMQEALATIAAGEQQTGGAPSSATPLAGGSQFDTLIRRGQAQIELLQRMGRGEAAMKMLPQITNAVENLAQARASATAARENEIEAATKRHEFTSRVMSGARDPASYAAARMQLQASGLFSPEDIKELPATYSPSRVAGIIAGSTAAKQKADIEREASRTASQNATDADLRRHRKVTEDLARDNHKLAVQREDRLESAGAERLIPGDKPLPAPTRMKLELVDAELKRSGIKVDKDGADALTANIAEQVEELVAGTRLSRQEATSRVIAEMEQRGELTRNKFSKDAYSPKEGSVTVPLPLPTSRDGLILGYYYRDPTSGAVKKFTGTAWEEVKRRKTRG